MNLRLRRISVYRVIFVACMSVLVLFVVFRAFAPPLWQVTRDDVRAVQQEVSTPGVDEKAPVVTGDFVAGEGIIESAPRWTGESPPSR